MLNQGKIYMSILYVKDKLLLMKGEGYSLKKKNANHQAQVVLL
jgi:hypothetical protein